RAVVVATPAHIASRLLGDLAKDSAIGRVRYAPGVVVVLGVKRDALVPFGYVVSEDAGLSGVFSNAQDDLRLLTVYYAREKAAAVRDLSRDELVARTVEHVNALGVGTLAPEDIVFSDAQNWPALGTVISAEPYETWTVDAVHPDERVWLAGDYTF